MLELLALLSCWMDGKVVRDAHPLFHQAAVISCWGCRSHECAWLIRLFHAEVMFELHEQWYLSRGTAEPSMNVRLELELNCKRES